MQPSFGALGSTLSDLEHADFALDLQAEAHNSTAQSAPSTSQSHAHSLLTSKVAAEPRNGLVTGTTPERDRIDAQLLSLQDEDKDHVEARKQANRAAQKKFRQRQKVRAQATAQELAAATKQLSRMKIQQQQLQTQLEQAHVQLQAKATAEVPLAAANATFEPVDDQPLRISIPGREQLLTCKEAQGMSPQQFRSLWADYVHMMRLCLGSLQQQADHMAEDTLAQLVSEAMRLRGISGRFVPKDTLKNPGKCASHEPLGKPQLETLVDLMALSQPQVEDLMFLRKVYILKGHELGLQRADLIEQMQQTRLHSVVSLAAMSQVTQKLQQNAAATMWTKYRFAWSLFLGVLTSIQATYVMLHCKPEVPIKDVLFEFVATKYGYASEENLLADSVGNVSDQDWNRALAYFESVSPSSPRQPWYVPIPQRQTPAKPPPLTLY